MPAAAPFIPPVNAPKRPTSLTSFIAALARLFPKLGKGTVAPAPPISTILSYMPNAPSKAPRVTNITSILPAVNLVRSINI